MNWKKLLPAALAACALILPVTASRAEQPFQHPGVLVSRAQLDFVKAQVAAKAAPFYTQFLRARQSPFGDLDYQLKGPPSDGDIACGSYSRPDLGCHAEDADAIAAYVQALLWYITGNHAYAANSIRIMNAYAHAVKAYTLSNAPLQAAWSSEMWPRAAEIIRYSNAGWAPADIAAFAHMLTKVNLPLIYNGSGANGNWELSMIDGMMGIAVFTNDHALLKHAADMWEQRVPAYFYYQPTDGNHPVPAPRGVARWLTQKVFDARVNGIPQEACRDFGHTGYGISATMAAAETAHIQGLRLYESQEKRLIAAMEFTAYYLLRNPIPSYVCDGRIKMAKAPTFVIGYNEFHNRLGQPMPYTKKWIDTGVLTNPMPSDMHTNAFEALTDYEPAPKTKSATSLPHHRVDRRMKQGQ
jgi:Alginate lyase